MTLADQNKITVYTSATSISTVYYLLSKYENPNTALIKIRKFKVLSKITKVDDDAVEKALNADFKDFEDALQYFGAIASGCNIIVTRNEKDYKTALIPVMNSEDFLTFFKSKK